MQGFPYLNLIANYTKKVIKMSLNKALYY